MLQNRGDVANCYKILCLTINLLIVTLVVVFLHHLNSPIVVEYTNLTDLFNLSKTL
jgi:hypothetical protein